MSKRRLHQAPFSVRARGHFFCYHLLMRSQFVVALIATLFFSSWCYYKTAGPCIVPREYSLGSIDPRFDMDQEAIKEVVQKSEEVWEAAAKRDLFVYKPNAPFKINFIYDDRQAKAESAESMKSDLDKKAEESASVGAQYKQLVSEYESLRAEYESQAASYEAKLKEFNETVEKYNKAGGAPENVYANLKKTEKSLSAEEAKLEAKAKEISSLAEQINSISEKSNLIAKDYNQEVQVFNNNFADGEEFTQGDYQGDSINIYHFKNNTELENVLVHEFGHAIGLNHVEGPESLMYYLMDKQPSTSGLSTEDLEALSLECAPRSSIMQKIDSWMVPLFKKFNLI